MKQVLMQGAARYIRGENALENLAEARAFGRRPMLVYGTKALAAAKERLLPRLAEYGFQPEMWKNEGYCSRSQLPVARAFAKERGCDFVLALGGGKCMDLGKAIAADLAVPVVTIPTIAATCAAVTPFSVMYDECGRHDGAIYHSRTVNLCLVDTEILRNAPVRTLCAGIIDAMAKLPELYCGGDDGKAPLNLTTARMLACLTDETLRPVCGELAAKRPVELEPILDAVIAVTGTCSGYASGTKQLAMAHAFNAAVRRQYPQAANQWLHGETVGVGILVQLHFSHDATEAWMEDCLKALDMPYSLASLGMNEAGVAEGIAKYMGFSPESAQYQEIVECVSVHR